MMKLFPDAIRVVRGTQVTVGASLRHTSRSPLIFHFTQAFAVISPSAAVVAAFISLVGSYATSTRFYWQPSCTDSFQASWPKGLGQSENKAMSLVFLGVGYSLLLSMLLRRDTSRCGQAACVAAMLGPEEQCLMQQLLPGVTLQDVTEMLRREVGVVRISLGLASNFRKFVQFVSLMGHEPSRRQLWSRWVESR